MKKTEEKIICFIDDHDLIADGDNVLVALSGGPDSIFVLHFLKKFQKKFSIEISAIHFNHQLRGKDSDEDELFAKQFCEKNEIDFFCRKLDVKKFAKTEKLSIEEAARTLRYQHLDKISQKSGFNKIVTAHNLSDNSETVLLNLLTGTASSGISGIPVKRENIIRPILCVTKNEILEYLSENRIDYRLDSSNLSDDFKRNFLRNRILPLLRGKINPLLDDAIFRSTKNIEAGNLLNRKVIDYFSSNFITCKNDSYEVNLKLCDVFGELPGELLKHFLRKNFSHEFKNQDYVKINALIENQKGRKLNLGNGVYVYKEGGFLRFLREKGNKKTTCILSVGEKGKIGKLTIGIEEAEMVKDIKMKKNYELIDADRLEDKFELRTWKEGDLFRPIGLNGTKKVSNFLTDIKISASQKKNQLVLLNRNQIIWVVGLRISDNVKITNKTKRVYKLWAN
jgi:tRNA(Ile)-lysidine synthase